MAKKKIINYKKIAKQLKQNKLINYDLRKTLSSQQKSAITRLWGGTKKRDHTGAHDGFGHLIKNPDVVRRYVSKKRAKQLKALDYPVHGRHVFIDTEGFENVHIRGDKIIKSRADGKSESDFLLMGQDILIKLKKLKSKKLPAGTFITVRIGDFSAFSTVVESYESLLLYVTAWQPKDDFADRENLISKMSIVTFKDGSEI